MLSKVSVIIPTWNRDQYVGKAIQSVLQQDYENLEIIVADNASTDNTKEIVANYLINSKVRYFCNESNIGPTANFNKALMHYATGDYVIILSDDDSLIDKTYISKAMSIFEADEEVVLVFANYQEVGLESGSVLRQAQFRMPSAILDGKWVWINYCKGFYCPLVSTLFSRKIAMLVGGYYMDIPSVDMLLFLLILLHGKAGFVPDIVANYAIHEQNHFKRINKQGDIQTLYNDLDFIRIPAKYALAKGVFGKEEIREWTHRMIVTRLREHISDYCLASAVNGDFTRLNQLYLLVKEGGEADFFYEALLSVFVTVMRQANIQLK